MLVGTPLSSQELGLLLFSLLHSKKNRGLSVGQLLNCTDVIPILTTIYMATTPSRRSTTLTSKLIAQLHWTELNWDAPNCIRLYLVKLNWRRMANLNQRWVAALCLEPEKTGMTTYHYAVLYKGTRWHSDHFLAHWLQGLVNVFTAELSTINSLLESKCPVPCWPWPYPFPIVFMWFIS